MDSTADSALQTGRHRDRALPWGVAGLAGIVLLVLVAVLTARLTGFEPAQPALGAVVETRTLGFRDASGGVVEIYDWDSGEDIARYGPGEGSFLRGVMRSLVRQRRGTATTADAFVLERYDDGRLIISDPGTGERIDLVAFGPDNAAVFALLLEGSQELGSTPVRTLD
jgi:putative photosynthetic complex assembly protein